MMMNTAGNRGEQAVSQAQTARRNRNVSGIHEDIEHRVRLDHSRTADLRG